MKRKSVRIITLIVLPMLVLGSTEYHIGSGTPCHFGSGVFSVTCPLGFLQMALAGKTLLPQLWLSVGTAILAIVLLGRFFCAWICPTALWQALLKSHYSPGSNRRQQIAPVSVKNEGLFTRHSPYIILGSALISSFIFGFPVFCLVCPVGLFFGALFALVRLVSIQQPGWELLVFPAMLGLELLIFKRWCHTLCPLGALLRLISKINIFARPTIDQTVCLRQNGADCRICTATCTETGGPLNGTTAVSDCTNCFDCADACPVRAIKFRFPFRDRGANPMRGKDDYGVKIKY